MKTEQCEITISKVSSKQQRGKTNFCGNFSLRRVGNTNYSLYREGACIILELLFENQKVTKQKVKL